MAKFTKGHPKFGGKQKGTKNQATIDKEAKREIIRQVVSAHLEPMLSAQVRNSLGIGHLMLKDPQTGRFERVVTTGDQAQDEARIDAAVATGNACWIYLKDPSIQAFADLMDRAFDKPAQPQKVMGEDGGPVEHVFRWQK